MGHSHLDVAVVVAGIAGDDGVQLGHAVNLVMVAGDGIILYINHLGVEYIQNLLIAAG